jgi:hypothetical protein
VAACLRVHEQPPEYRDLLGTVLGVGGAGGGGGVVGSGLGEGDVADDAAIEFGDPCGDVVRAD